MNKLSSQWKAGLSVVALLVLVAGATGCTKKIKEMTDKAREVTQEVADTATSGQDSSTMTYLNNVVSAVEFPSDRGNWVYSMLDNHYEYTDNEKECRYGGGTTSELEAMEDQSSLLGSSVSLSDKSVQDKVEPKFEAFIDAYSDLVTAHNEFNDYCDRESYKDDGGAQIKTLAEDLKNKLNTFQDADDNLSEVIEGIQDSIDIGIDENTTDPQEVIVLASDTITKDAKKAYRAYNTWLKSKLEGDNPDAAEMKSAHTDFKADLDKYTKKAEAVNAEADSTMGTHFSSYLDAVKEFDVEYEKFVRDAENGNITGERLDELMEAEQGYWGGEITETYNGIIDAHNWIVNASSY